MERLVVDSSVLAASFLESDRFHQESLDFIAGLENGSYTFHVPNLGPVEVLSAVSRQSRHSRLAVLARTSQSLIDWEQAGVMVLYPLDRDCMERSSTIAIRFRLRGSDSVFAALAEELDIPLKTFDQEILDRFPLANRS
ncbi:MAG: type II toxin-antitoxin system VapC family toxin [Chloroflexi bacterium]|nr:type II toxin-antitoxin system VapC family toxin [Chloroflexota bacterium]